MKILVQTVLWCPEDQVLRLETIKTHLSAFSRYEGEFDLYIVDNGSSAEQIQEYVKALGERKFLLEHFDENMGWAWARNRGIKKCLEQNYDILIMMDCDITVTINNWIDKAVKAARIQPAFMCRMSKASGHGNISQCTGHEKILGTNWDFYDEWYGSINVVTPLILKRVGGFDLTTFPQQWGYHDCEWGRRLFKAGAFSAIRAFPSLAGLGVTDHQDPSYNRLLSDMKNLYTGQYGQIFARQHKAILEGTKPVFFDYNTGQTDLNV